MSAPTPPSAYRIQQAVAHAHELRDALLADPDYAFDPDLLRDTLDSETDAVALVRRLVRYVLDTDAMAAAAKARLADLAARKARFEARSDRARATVQQMLEALDIRSLADPEFSLSVSQGRGSVVIVDEASVPEQFIKTERRIDRAGIGAALKAGALVAGAVIGNAQQTLTIRTK